MDPAVLFRVPFQELFKEMARVLRSRGFSEPDATPCASLFAEASLDGAPAQGVERFPDFVRQIDRGVVRVDGRPECLHRGGAFERWTGSLGPGNLNAQRSMARAIELARDHGFGVVALQETNAWIRGGSYGWQAAEAGMIGICWSNTTARIPPWGGRTPRLGSNPFVIAVPRMDGHVVLDMALSQFSRDTLEAYRVRGEMLPFEGGFDPWGRLTRDPEAIEASNRPLPAGYWKGAGFALVLDILAVLLSGGRATHELGPSGPDESHVSQVFVAADLARLSLAVNPNAIVNAILAHFHGNNSEPLEPVFYPGERTLQLRKENMELGVPVEPNTWLKVQSM